MANPDETTTTTAEDTTAVQDTPAATEAPTSEATIQDAQGADVKPSEGLPVTEVEPAAQQRPDPGIVVTEGNVPAQVVGAAPTSPTQAPVNEVYVTTDRVILDVNDPLAVQPGASTPDPLTIGVGKTPEQQFSDAE